MAIQSINFPWKEGKMLKLKQLALSFVLLLLSLAAIAQENPMGLVAGASAALVASQYDLIDRANGVYLYANKSRTVFVQLTDLRKASLENAYEQKTRNTNSFNRKQINSFAKGNYFSVINGVHFDYSKNPTTISFPFTPDGVYWGSRNENNRALCVKSNNVATVELTGTGTPNYSYACKFSVILLHPDVDKGKKVSKGRTYIGVPSKNNHFVLFFVTKNRTQGEMEAMANLWGVPKQRLIMGDGSASSQYYGRYNRLYGIDGKGNQYRNIPHAIVTRPGR